MLAKVLQQLMKDCGDISLSKLGKETLISKATLHGILQGSSPQIKHLQKLAEYFDVSLDYLINGCDRRSESLDDLLDKFTIHNGIYEVKIKRMVPKRNHYKKEQEDE